MRGKLLATHRERMAYVYVRQSSPAQVFEHGESTARQYALAERAEALGWSPQAVEVIDEDLGRSGATADARTGFARLVDAVARGQAGAIFAIEVSRLARSSLDWQRLLSLCAVAGVAVVDEDSVYDPSDKDDKLLLDLKGTMSEAELHWLGLRLHGARRSKARRGALPLPAPTGYVWNEDRFEFDPDESVQQAIRTVFDRFAVEPSAWAVVRWGHETGFRMPTRRRFADGTSQLEWRRLGVARLSDILHNPVYAGAYVYGRRPSRKVIIDGKIRQVRSPDSGPGQWPVLIEDFHPGYITWETYLDNLDKLKRNRTFPGRAKQGAPREGRALLSGLLICGRCGRGMAPHYWGNGSGKWSYVCGGERDRGAGTCWAVAGEVVDRAVEELLLSTLVPSELELSLAVERELEQQSEALAQGWRLRIDKASYEARLAERRYMAVDPDNRVVARTLERQWELKLREVEEVERQYEEARRAKRVELSDEDRVRVRELARDLPAVWRAPTTLPADRKAMLRLVIEAVSLAPVDVPRRETLVSVQWQGGAVDELRIPRPRRAEWSRTPPDSLARLRELVAEGLRDEIVAERLNEEGLKTGKGKTWNLHAVRWARQRNGIKKRYADKPRRMPLPARHPDGRYSIAGVAERFGVSVQVVRGWLRRGLVVGEREDFGPHRGAWWLDINEETAAQLEALPRRRATRSRTQTNSQSK